MKFKVGDEVIRTDIQTNDIKRVITRISDDYIYYTKNGYGEALASPKDLELVTKPKGRQPTKKLHLVIRDDCQNIIGSIKNNLNEAKNFNVDSRVAYTIYKLVPVLKVEMSKKFTKVKVEKKKR